MKPIPLYDARWRHVPFRADILPLDSSHTDSKQMLSSVSQIKESKSKKCTISEEMDNNNTANVVI